MIRRNTRADVFFFCGCIFTPIGIIALVLACFMAKNMDYLIAHGEGDVRLMPVIFGFCGAVASVIGVLLLVQCFRKRQMKRWLIERGEYIIADITAVPCDYNVRVNGWPTFRVECSYRDPVSGIVHLFLSENLLIDPAYYITQPTVRVYVDRDSDYHRYYVDIDSILPEVRRD